MDDLGETTMMFNVGLLEMTGLEPTDTFALQDVDTLGFNIQICARIWCDGNGMHAEPLWFVVSEDGDRITGGGLTILQAQHDMWPLIKRIVAKHYPADRLDRIMRLHSAFAEARRVRGMATDNVVHLRAQA